MIRIKQFYGDKLRAADGEIGHVKDLYFDDESWAVRYLVADTGPWLPERQVLISPCSISRRDGTERVLHVNLTRRQIENSPSIEPRVPVSRHDEEEYCRYYGWPCYWHGEELWGMSGFPHQQRPAKTLPDQPAAGKGARPKGASVHLKSTRALGDSHSQARDGMGGHVCDLMMDPRSWAIRELIIKTGHRFSSTEMGIPTSKVERISWDKTTMFISLTKQTVDPTLPLHSTAAGAAC